MAGSCSVLSVEFEFAKASPMGFTYHPRRSGKRRWFTIMMVVLVAESGLGLLDSHAAEPFTIEYGEPRYELFRWRAVPRFGGRRARSLTESEDGAIWFGTRSGVVRYDGYEWREFDLAGMGQDVPMRTILAGPDASVWAGRRSGLLVYHRGEWSRWTGIPDAQSLVVRHLARSGESDVWFALRDGQVARAQQDGNDPSALRWTFFDDDFPPGQSEPTEIACTSTGVVWALRSDSEELWYYDGTDWVPRTPRLSWRHDNNARFLFAPRDGTVWVLDGSRLLVLRDGETLFDHERRWLGTTRPRILECDDGVIWAANGEVVKRRETGSARWTCYRELTFQCDDEKGRRWFLRDGAVIQVRGTDAVRFDERDGLMASVESVVSSRRFGIWAFGTHGGALASAWFQDGSWKRWLHGETREIVRRGLAYSWSTEPLFLIDGYDDEAARAIRYDGEQWHTEFVPARPDFVAGVAESADGKIWYVSRNRLSCIGDGQADRSNDPDLSRLFVASVINDAKGNVWVLEHDGRVLQRTGST